MAAEAEAQAKQLDSVTDNIAEQEVDADRAAQALSGLSNPANTNGTRDESVSSLTFSKSDIDFIITELEVSEHVAIEALRVVAMEALSNGTGPLVGADLLKAALHKLITS
jgi:NACalpha-BTF3-like transcription factor